MTDLIIRKTGPAGYITLNRPQALNALTYDMCLEIEGTLDIWRNDNDVNLILIDGAGERAFCSGGDIADMYKSGQTGDLSYGRNFWRDEYRLNAKIANYPKPIVTFLHGFTMGGGVGVGCHASHRIVCETSQIAMPEVTIGLIPDVGGSLLLANAPGFTGTYLGLTGDRMDASDAIFAGFADHFVPKDQWDNVKSTLLSSGDTSAINSLSPPPARLADWQTDIGAAFAGATLSAIYANLSDTPPLAHARKLMDRNAPLAMGAAIPIIDAARNTGTIEAALEMEYRFTYRAVADSDFIEGIRAAIIDRDRTPKWRDTTAGDILKMTAPLGAATLDLSGAKL
jgi:enoyl-CoA hydratase